MTLAALLIASLALGAWIGWAVGHLLERRRRPRQSQRSRPVEALRGAPPPVEGLRSGAAGDALAYTIRSMPEPSAWAAVAAEREMFGGSLGLAGEHGPTRAGEEQ